MSVRTYFSIVWINLSLRRPCGVCLPTDSRNGVSCLALAGIPRCWRRKPNVKHSVCEGTRSTAGPPCLIGRLSVIPGFPVILGAMVMQVIIQENQKGLLVVNGKFSRLLGAGRYRAFGTRVIEAIGFSSYAVCPGKTVPVSVLERNNDFREQTVCIDVHDGEYVMHFADGVFLELLVTAGRYFFWKDVCNHEFRTIDVSSPEVAESFPTVYFAKLAPALYSVVEVRERERAALYFDRRFVRFLEPGKYYFWKNGVTVSTVSYPSCLVQKEIVGQEILTADKVTLRINCICDYAIVDFQRIAEEVDDYDRQLHTAVQLALREYVGKYRIDEILENKDGLTDYLTNVLIGKGKELFLDIRCVSVRDIILPGEIREIMNTVLIAEKRAQANVIARREEVASTRSLLNTARLMDENETLYKLKEWEYVERICEKVESIHVSGGDFSAQLAELLAGKLPEKKKK